MTERDVAWQQLLDPNTPAERLGQIATNFPEFHEQVLAHPKLYPELGSWIALQRAQVPAEPAMAITGGPAAAGVPAPATKSRSKLWLSLGCVALILGLAGGAYWMFIGSKIAGSDSPEAAAEKLIMSVANMDSLSLYGSIAPSEIEPIRNLMDGVQVETVDESAKALQDSIGNLTDALEIKVSGLEFTTEEIEPTINRVELVAGTFVIDVDTQVVRDEMAEILATFVTEEPDLRWALEDLDNALRELEYELPLRLSVAELRNDMDGGYFPAFMTVEEGGKWYVSPLLTLFDLSTADHRVYYGGYNYGQLIEATPAASPEEALNETALAFNTLFMTGNYRDFAATLSLPERRVLSLYGPVMFEDFVPGNSELNIQPGFKVTHTGDDRAYLLPDDLTWTYWDSNWRDYRTTSITEHCITSDGHTNCLDLRQETGLQSVPSFFDELLLVAVQENGGWVFSGIATLEELTATINRTFTPEVLERILEEESRY